ncbi:MAG: hypothetical protein K0Q86_2350, partial [Arthrobacter koreensis]|nr:hypothetical protein [Arthrobacter koreensis]
MKPIPAMKDMPRISIQARDLSMVMPRNRVTRKVPAVMPTALPRTRPADRLAQNEAADDAEGDTAAQRIKQAGKAADGNARGEEREHGHCDCAGENGPFVSEMRSHAFVERLAVVLGSHPDLGTALGDHWNHETKQDAGYCRVDSRGMNERPDGHAERDQDPPGTDAPLDQNCEDCQRQEGDEQRKEGDAVGVEDSDDGDRQQIIHHGERQQECPQRRWQEPSNDGNH